MRHRSMFVGAGALTALGVLAAPQLASAHIADVVKSCDHLEVSVDLFDDAVQTRVTIDGTTTVRSGNGHWTFPWTQTERHAYEVVVDAVNPEDDKTFNGEQEACVAPPESTATTTPTIATVPQTAATVQETTTTQAGTTAVESSTPTTQGTPITQSLGVPTARPTGGGGGGSGGAAAPSGSGSGALPSTGPNDTAPFIAAGIAALTGGSVLVYVARRRTGGSTPH